MITHYHYDKQLRAYILQFCGIFSGLHVQTGKGECREAEFIPVPIVVGSKDRVVAALMAGNTQNRTFALPIMAAQLTGLARADDRRKKPGLVDQRVTMPVGGVFPNDLTVVKRAFPVPYDATIELAIHASNQDQLYQILEQVLVLFNPDLQIQKSDGAFDWTRITRVELMDISNEENYPMRGDRRTITWTLSFMVPLYLNIPMGVKDDLVRKIIIQIGDLSNANIGEVDADGHIVPFGNEYGTIVISEDDVIASGRGTFISPDQGNNAP